MPIFQTLFPESSQQGNLRSEFVNLNLDTFCNLEYMNNFLIFKVPNGVIETLQRLLDKFLTLFSINLLPISIHPLFNTINPIISNQPQIAIWKEILR